MVVFVICYDRTMKHGTSNGYNVHQCRCDDCRAWSSARQKLARARETPEQREARLAKGRERMRERTPEQIIATRKRTKSKRRELVWSYKRTPCMHCGGSFHPAAMDFHHIDPATKEFSPGSDAHKVSEARLLAEIEKCIIICSNCHRTHHAMMAETPEHAQEA